MPYASEDAGDFDKLRTAFNELTTMFGSVEDLLKAFGLADMPQAQRYGILFGCLVFITTITAVVGLLVIGGTMKRIQEQAETGDATMLSPQAARAQRALLLERLLDSRERMIQNSTEPPKTEGFTPLTTMLMNVAPQTDELAELVSKDNKKDKKKQEIRQIIPPYYEENYVASYRKCQDRPGGAVVPGRPEARFEAYARGFAGCGPYTSAAYRRSYGRLYELICCGSHAADDKYINLWKTRPQDIIGRFVRLEPLEQSRHLKDFCRVTSGEPALENKAYDPEEIWGFLEEGPFKDEKAMRKSFVFQRKMSEASFAIVHGVTERCMGAMILTNDDPKNLTIQLEPPMIQPFREGGKEQLEACYLLMDRLYAYGYRRIQISIDSQDVEKRKLATRLGFTLEGILYKHMVVKECNRDSSVYGLLNNDWKRGARGALFRKLYGAAAERADLANEKREEEFDEQERFLKEQRRKDAEESKQKKV